MERSLFSKASSYKERLLSDSSHELPRWRTPSPMAASTIPPPIVQSTYASPQTPIAQSAVIRKSTPYEDRQHELEADLQFLLDAQADGLAGGTGSRLPDDQTSTGSTTPTARSVRSGSVRPSYSRARRKPGIRSARKGIYNAILALSRVKEEEISDIDQDLRSKQHTLEKIDGWQRRRQGLQEASKDVDANEDMVRSQRLRQEAETLQEEISHVELQLSDMKGRHRKLMREVAAAENAVQAKMASYTSSLKLLEEDVQKFLSLNPTNSTSRPTSSDGSVSLWLLPPKRRTLDMAKEYWNEERTSVMQNREGIEHEKVALDEGAMLWKEIVVQLTDFERLLRTEMASTKAQGATSSSFSKSASVVDARMGSELLDRMDTLISELEGKFELATSRRWNLLIAAIGAELDALRQGRLLLGGVGSVNDQNETERPSSSTNPSPAVLPDDEITDQPASVRSKRWSNGSAPEDDPDPELLFSRHDLDSE